MAGRAAVGVDDDLAAGEAAVAVRAADHEVAGRVHEDPDVGGRRLLDGSIGLITCSIRSGLIRVSASMPGWCWVEISTVVSRFGVLSS